MVKRFLLSYLLFLAVPIFMGVIFYIRTIQVLHGQIQERGLQNLEKSGQTLELILQEVDRISAHLGTSEPLLDLGSRPDILGAPQISQLVDYVANTRLIPYSLTNPYIREYYVVFRDSRTVFVPGMATSLSSHYRYMHHFEGLDLPGWEEEYLVPVYQESYLPARRVWSDERSYWAVPYVDSVVFRGRHLGAIVILLDADRLLSLFDEIDISDGGAVLVSDETGRLMASRTTVPDSLDRDAVLGAVRPAQAVRLGKSIVMQTALERGWKVTALQSTAYLRREASYISTTTLAVVACFLLVGVVVAILLANRASKPLLAVVRELSEQLPARQPGSSTDVYGLLRSTVRRLISRTNQLQEELEDQRPFMQRLFLDELLGGLLYDDDNVLSLARQVGLEIDGRTFGVFIVRLEPLEPLPTAESLQEIELHKMILRTAVQEGWPRVLVHDVEQDKVAFIYASASEDKQQFYDELKAILHSMEERVFASLSVAVTVAVGGCHRLVRNLYRSYRQARVAMNYHVELGPRLTWYHEVFAEDSVGFWYPPSIESRLAMFVRGGFLDDAKSLLEEIRRKNFRERTLPFAMRSIVVSLLRATLIRVYGETSLGEAELEARIEEVTQPSNEDFPAQYDAVVDVLTQVCERLAAAHRDHSRVLKNKMVAYLQQNYADKNLSLTSMADHLGLSMQYLSRLCRDHLGENFHVYLEGVRMEAVRARLRASPSVQLKTVVAECGYASLNTFAKAFKRRYGINATEYRRRLLDGKAAADDAAGAELSPG